MRITLIVFGALLIFSCKKRNSKIPEHSVTEPIPGAVLTYKKSKKSSTLSPKTIEDSIRQHFDISDSLTVLSTEYYGLASRDEHSRAFIDYNTNSIFHDDIQSDYGCDCLNKKNYSDIYYENYNKYKDNILVDYEDYQNLLGDWIPLRKYKKGFYLDRVICEYNRHGFTLSDSALIEYDMDGPYPNLLLGIEQNDTLITIKTSTHTYHLKRLSGIREIYTYEGSYIIHNRNLHHYPIIVTDCHEVGMRVKISD